MTTESEQLGIVKFLNGERYLNYHVTAHMDLRRELLDFGFDSSKEAKHVVEKMHSRFFSTKAAFSMERSGFNAHKFCSNCNNFKSEGISTVNDWSMSDSVSYKSVIRCDAGGCDRARLEFVRNFQEMDRSGKALIDIRCEMEDVEPMRSLSPFDDGTLTRRKRGVRLTATSRVSSRDPWFVKSSIPKYSTSHKEDEEKLLQETVRDLIESDEDRYGVTAW